MRTLLVLVEWVVITWGPLALFVTLSRRYRLAHGVDPEPRYPGDQPLIGAGAIVAGVLLGIALLVVLSDKMWTFNNWLLG